eukprot:SAG25_NODE_3408_length_1093_cov_1.663984_1_plen_70_part_10
MVSRVSLYLWFEQHDGAGVGGQTDIYLLMLRGAGGARSEADAAHPGGKYDGYACTFRGMIHDARWTEYET